MKFKIAVLALLTAMLAVLTYTGYVLTAEAKKQTFIQATHVTLQDIGKAIEYNEQCMKDYDQVAEYRAESRKYNVDDIINAIEGQKP